MKKDKNIDKILEDLNKLGIRNKCQISKPPIDGVSKMISNSVSGYDLNIEKIKKDSK